MEHFFLKMRTEQTEINRLQSLIEEKTLSLLPGAIRYDKDKIQISPEDTMSRILTEVSVMQAKVDRLDLDLKRRMNRALDILPEIDSLERQVVMLYYMMYKDGHLLTWDDVAGEMGRSDRYVKEIRNRAMKSLEKVCRRKGIKLWV